MSLWLPLTIIGLAWLWRGPSWRPRPLGVAKPPRPWMLGHRGARGPRRENTLPAFELAFAYLDGLETDVQRTRDGVLVLWHDFDVLGRDVDSTDFAELREREPDLTTLDALLDLAQGHPDKLLNLEIKSRSRPLRSWSLERDVVRAVRASGASPRVLVSSFDPLALVRVRLLAPGLRTALLTAASMPSLLRGGALAGWLHVDALHPELEQVDAGLRERAEARGLPLHVWTVNEPEAMRRLAREGVAGVIGDDPATMARHLAAAPASAPDGSHVGERHGRMDS